LAKFARFGWGQFSIICSTKNLHNSLCWLIQSWEIVAKSILQPNPLWAQKKERKKETPRLEISKLLNGYNSPKEKHLSPSISKMSNPNVLNITWTSYYKLHVHIIHSQSSMTRHVHIIHSQSSMTQQVHSIHSQSSMTQHVHIIHSQSSMTQKYNRFNPGMSQVNYFIIPKNRINDQTIQLFFWYPFLLWKKQNTPLQLKLRYFHI
jgi:hypothetical protein